MSAREEGAVGAAIKARGEPAAAAARAAAAVSIAPHRGVCETQITMRDVNGAAAAAAAAAAALRRDRNAALKSSP